MKLPLEGLRVLELGGSEAAGVAALLLSDFGAEVIRIDDPSVPALSPEDAAAFGLPAGGVRLCDRGKRRVFLDLRLPEQRTLFRRLLTGCAAVIDGRSPREAPAEETAALRREFPQLIYTRVTGYGAAGPMAERLWSEAAVQAESGFVSTTGEAGGEPIRSGGDVAAFLGGLVACIGTLSALLDRERSGGRLVDVSMMDSLLFGLENQFSLYLRSGVIPVPQGNRYALSAPVGNYRCADGKELMISVATETQWAAFAEAVGRRDWLDRPEYATVALRLENCEALNAEVSETFAAFRREALMEILQSRGCIYGCINDFAAVESHPQTSSRRLFRPMTGPDGERFAAPTDPILRDELPEEKRIIRAPGSDTRAILAAAEDAAE